MRRLWKILPPPMADNFGFMEAMSRTDGMGIIDDCGAYRMGRKKHEGSDSRVCHTEIQSEDIVSGTRQKVLDAFAREKDRYRPKFVILSAGPCSAMIGTDLSGVAEQIERDTGIPAAAAEISGHKTYDEGMSEAFYSMVRLLCRPQPVLERSINLLGANTFDWPQEAAQCVRDWFEEKEYRVIAGMGGRVTASEIEKMPAASVNVVLTVSGLKAAKYLKETYGTPYIAMAPFGKDWCERMKYALEKREQPKTSPTGKEAEILVIGEQLTANAVREALRTKYSEMRIQVATFYKFAKELADPLDVRIKDEDSAGALLQGKDWKMVIGDPLLRPLAPEHIKWIGLPHKVFCLYGEPQPAPCLLGDGLDAWLDEQWNETEG